MRISFCAQVSAAAQSSGTPTWTCVCRAHRASCTRRRPRATHVRGRTLAHVNEFTEWLRANGVFETGKSVEDPPDVWKLAAITSFSVLAVVLIGAALIIGVMVHRRKSHKRPLRGETLERSDFMCNQTEAVSYPKSQKTTTISVWKIK